jgi:hypothetical protein
MTEQSIKYAEAAIESFRGAFGDRDDLAAATQAAIDTNHHVAGLDDEGNPEIRIWHALYSLVAFSDNAGLFRNQVFGEPQPGGPIVHKISNGIRSICAARGYDFNEMLENVCQDIDQFERPVPFR